jgi:TM2 domain-containing membrane protein YozV
MKCRFCGEFLDGARREASPQVMRYASVPPTHKQKDPGLAAVLSVIIPGLGQVYNGQIGFGILMGIICFPLDLILVGLPLHIWLICNAYSYANQLNQGTV